jgi:thymidylate synthase
MKANKNDLHESGRVLTQEQFINKIKNDDVFANKWGELGPIYGKQWRRWTKKKMYLSTDGSYEKIYDEMDQTVIDQIAILINDLKTNPDSRRLLVSAWNPADLDSCVLPPCHYGFQVYTRELSDEEKWEQYSKSGLNIEINGIPLELKHMGTKFYPNSLPQRTISLMFNMRSNDVPLGLPFNIASYGLLLEIIGKMVNMVPDELIANLGDAHIYLNQIDGVKEQITKEPFPLPTLKHMKTEEFYKSLSENVSLFGHLDPKDFQIEGYQSHPTIKMPLSN